MNTATIDRKFTLAALAFSSLFVAGRALAADSIKGQVLGGGAPIAKSTVTLWAASQNAPKQLSQTTANDDGRFELSVNGAPADSSLYLVANGGEPKARGGGNNPAIGLLAVVGSKPQANVVINEMTTVASVWTNAQFLDGWALKGHALGLRIAAGNVPSFVDLETGGWGGAIQDPLNSGQTPTRPISRRWPTCSPVASRGLRRMRATVCSTPRSGPAAIPPWTRWEPWSRSPRTPGTSPRRSSARLAVLRSIGEHSHASGSVYAVSQVRTSAWVLPLKFDGGGYKAGGKAMFDSEGNLWVGDNFSIGWQGQDSLWQGHATKFAPNGQALSPATTGFTGGGMEGGTFGAAVDSHDNAWLTNYGSKWLQR